MKNNGKIINKILICVLFLSFSLMFIFTNNIKAASKTTYDDTKTGSWTPEIEEVTNFNGLEHIYTTGKSTYNGELSDQQINVFKMKTDGISSKLVSWAISDGNANYRLAQLTKIAEDYEKNHPGWIVMAGINADQYQTRFGSGGGPDGLITGTPYYPVIMDGEARFPFASINGVSCQYIGFKNDGSTDGIIDGVNTKCFAVYVLDENENEITHFELAGINKQASNGQTTVWTSLASNKSSGQYISKTIPTTENSVYYIEQADLAYAHNSSEYGMYDVFYGKGTISSIINSGVVGKGQFAIETSNEEVKNALSVGVKIKVQAKFESDEMNNVETAAGYHMIHRMDGKDCVIPGYSANQLNIQYDAKSYNRSIFGQTADGTYVLLTADKSNTQAEGTKYKGLRFWEANAVLKHYGVIEAYQQDGGGSVTAIIRNGSGKFDVVNTPSDSKSGSQRSVFNGLFFVVRDPGFVVNNKTITRNSIEINTNDNTVLENLKNIKVEINNKTYEMTSNSLTIGGLEEDTEYVATIKYDFEEDGIVKTGTYQVKAKTKAFVMPDPGLEISKINKESITIIKRDTEHSSWIQNVVVHVGDNTYNMGNENEYEITDLIEDTEYNVYFSYNVVEPSTGNIYNGETEKSVISTLSIELPVIIKFEMVEINGTTAKFTYEYEDKDDAVELAQIIYNGQKYTLTRKRGNLIIENFDVKTNNKVTMKLYYYEKEGNIFTDEISEEIEVEVKQNEIETKPGKKGCFKTAPEYLIATLSATSLLVLIIRKKH